MKVVFIIGWERSGSTLLANLLEEGGRSFNVGEIHQLWNEHSEVRLCGCGKLPENCDFWSTVLNDVSGANAIQQTSAQMSVFRQVTAPTYRFLKVRRMSDPRVRQYSRTTRALYESVHGQTNCDLIIDCSKAPTFAEIARHELGDDVYFVHLVRDPRAVAFSWTRKRFEAISRSTAHSSIRWLVWNSAADLLRRKVRKERWMRMRYEDMAGDPAEAILRLLEFLSFQPSKQVARNRTLSLRPNHAVGGNPFRFELGNVEVRPDEEWTTSIRRKDRLLSTLITFPLLRRYGYPVRSSRTRTTSKFGGSNSYQGPSSADGRTNPRMKG